MTNSSTTYDIISITITDTQPQGVYSTALRHVDKRPERVASNKIHYDQAGFRNGKDLNLYSERSRSKSRPKR